MAGTLKEKYKQSVKAIKEEQGYNNWMQVPRLEKVVLNIGVGEASQNLKALESAEADLVSITGQKPIITRSRRSIAAFRLREGMPVGLMVTLRGRRMYEFLAKLINVTLPRIREFRGVPTKGFDGRGNYSIGFKEQTTFPEIDYNKIDKLRGLEVNIVTTAKTDAEAKCLLSHLGMPFSID
jgi:large subunit ribosomal protein L5